MGTVSNEVDIHPVHFLAGWPCLTKGRQYEIFVVTEMMGICMVPIISVSDKLL